MKLTSKQKEVISLMRIGWGLAFRHGMIRPSTPRKLVWLQQGDIGHGGKSIRLREETVMTLCQKKLIEPSEINAGGSNYILTELGKTCSLI